MCFLPPSKFGRGWNTNKEFQVSMTNPSLYNVLTCVYIYQSPTETPSPPATLEPHWLSVSSLALAKLLATSGTLFLSVPVTFCPRRSVEPAPCHHFGLSSNVLSLNL